jgi:hypothetical protein
VERGYNASMAKPTNGRETTKHLELPLTEDEHTALKVAAAKAHVTLRDYVRSRTLAGLEMGDGSHPTDGIKLGD